MKRLIVGLAAIALTGCATVPVATPSPTVTVTAPPPTTAPPTVEPEPTYSPEELFIQTIENKYGSMPPRMERKAISFAKQTCRNFDAYGVKQTIKFYASEIGTKKEAKFAGYLMGVGAATFCPEYGDYLDGTST